MIKLRISESIYYKNKKKFVSLYKELGLHWEEASKEGDVWTNEDFTSYLRKIPEENGKKRFYAYNVPELVEFFLGIGAEEFSGEDIPVSVVHQVSESVKSKCSIPENFMVVVGSNVDASNMSESFKIKWRMLELQYANYTCFDLYRELNKGKEKSPDDDEEVVIKRKKKGEDDVLPSRKEKKKKKAIKEKIVKVVSSSVKKEFKRKTFKIMKK